jgi:tryptophan-rich sensory protein
MSTGHAVITSLGAGGLAAGLEGLCAGKNVKSFFSELRFPRYSPPLWLWSVIGGLYYITFCFVLYRLLVLNSDSWIRPFTIILVLFMMTLNALVNYVIFRAKNLHLNLIVTALFPVMDLSLLICLLQLDNWAAWPLIPYMFYRIYSIWWCYSIWKMNAAVS